jgi:hypothetical protein
MMKVISLARSLGKKRLRITILILAKVVEDDLNPAGTVPPAVKSSKPLSGVVWQTLKRYFTNLYRVKQEIDLFDLNSKDQVFHSNWLIRACAAGLAVF